MIDEIKVFIDTSKQILSAIKALKELLPAGDNKDRIAKDLERAAKELAMAEVAMAKAWKYDLCQCTFPPQIMLFKVKDNKTECPACGYSLSKNIDIQCAEGRIDFKGF